jgi:hypothetical protein
VNIYLKDGLKNISLVLHKKSCGYTIIQSCLSNLPQPPIRDLSISTASAIPENDLSMTSSSKSKLSCFKQFVKGTLMNTLFTSSLEDSINKITDIGTERFRPIKYNYTSLDVYFENDKSAPTANNSLNMQKFLKAITVDAYRDIDRITTVFHNWKKSKIVAQSMFKSSLEVEREAATLMANVMYTTGGQIHKGVLKDLYHMCNEMMSHNTSTPYALSSKRETIKIIINFVNMNIKGANLQRIPSNQGTDGQSSTNSTARIKKNYSFTSSKNVADPNTISVHHSLQRESRRDGGESSTDMLLEYPTSISAQSSNKLKSKKSLPIGSAVKSASSKHGEVAKSDTSKFEF